MTWLLTLVIMALSPTTYHAHGTRPLPTDLPSCGAAARLMTDRYSVVLDRGEVRVNGTLWTVSEGWKGGFLLEYRAEPDALTFMFMEIRENGQGELALKGMTAERRPCADRVSLRVR